MAVDIGEDQFQTAVLDRSRDVPVVVDFWAPWCGPCRQLTPALERAAAAREGKVDLVKVNTDENPQWAMKYGVQGIPTMLFVKDGDLFDRMVGAAPKPYIQARVDAMLEEAVAN